MKISLKSFILISLCFFGTSCQRSDQPASDLPNLKFEKVVLENGLNVIFHVDRRVPVVHLNLWYHVGSKDEDFHRQGFAHLFEHLMFQGSVNARENYNVLAERAGAVSGSGVNATTSFDRTNYYTTVPKSSLEYLIWLESDRMANLPGALTQKTFETERDVVKNEKRESDNRPYSREWELMSRYLHPDGHPYQWLPIGRIDHLNEASLEDVKRFFKKFYHPNNCSLVVSGDFELEEAKKLVKKYFGPIPPGPPISRPKVWIPKLAHSKKVVDTDRVEQVKLSFFWPAPEYFNQSLRRLQYASSVLASGKNSRLYRRLVRDEQLASSVYAYAYGREISGIFAISALVRPAASVERVREIIFEEITQLARGGPTADEMKRNKASLKFAFVSALEGIAKKADQLNEYNTYLGNPDHFLKEYEGYQDVKANQVQKTFKSWIARKPHLEIRIVPEKPKVPEGLSIDRRRPPALGGEVAFQPPSVEQASLENGLKVYVVHRPELPKVNMRLLIKRGNLGELKEKSGVGYFTAQMMDEGTKGRSALEIENDLDMLGVNVSVSGTKYGSEVSLSALKEKVDPAMDIVSDLVLNPSFPKKELELHKKNRQDQIKREKADPSTIASHLFQFSLFEKEAPAGFSARGHLHSVPNITREDLIEEHQKFWVPNNSILVMVGDMTLGEVVELLKKKLKNWKPGKLEERKKVFTAPPQKTKIFMVDQPGAPQSEIRIGSVGPTRYSEDYVALRVLGQILGGGFGSRLMMNLREKRGYTYGAYAHFAMFRDFGFWMASTAVQTAVTQKALLELRKEIKGIRGTIPVKKKELTRVQDNISKGYYQKFETSSQVLNQISHLAGMEIPTSFLGEFLGEVSQQTVETTTQMAKKYLDFNQSIVLVVGDLKKIEKPIRSLGWGEVTVLDIDGNKIR